MLEFFLIMLWLALLIMQIVATLECEFDYHLPPILCVLCIGVNLTLGIVALNQPEIKIGLVIAIIAVAVLHFIIASTLDDILDGTKNINLPPIAEATKKHPGCLIVLAAIAFVFLIGWVLSRSSETVDPGERAIKRSWGRIVPQTYEPGIVWYLPFSKNWGNEVIKIPIRPQRYGYDVPVRTKELQRVTLNCAILCQINVDSVHVMYDKYTGYANYEEAVIRDMVQSTMLALSSQMSFWSFAGNETNLMTEATEYIVNDQLMRENLVKIETFRLKGYQASSEVENLIEQTIQARQNIEIEKLKLERAKIETEKVKQEAIQTYERLAAEAKAHGIDIQIKAKALKNPFVAQYEVAKALQKWNGDLTLPNTLMTMSQAANGGGGSSIFPVVPITTK